MKEKKLHTLLLCLSLLCSHITRYSPVSLHRLAMTLPTLQAAATSEVLYKCLEMQNSVVEASTTLAPLLWSTQALAWREETSNISLNKRDTSIDEDAYAYVVYIYQSCKSDPLQREEGCGDATTVKLLPWQKLGATNEIHALCRLHLLSWSSNYVTCLSDVSILSI